MATFGGRRIWLLYVERGPLWGGRGVIWQNFFKEYNMFIVLSSCLLYPIMSIICNHKWYTERWDTQNNLNNVLNENVNVTKWTSIVDNLCLLQQYKLMEHNQKTIPWLVINVPYGSIFVTIPDFFISYWKTGRCWEVILPVDDTL